MLWVDGVDPSLSESQLEKHFSKYGNVVRMGFDRQGRTAMVQYETVDEAKEALGEIKGGYIGNNRSRIMVSSFYLCSSDFIFILYRLILLTKMLKLHSLLVLKLQEDHALFLLPLQCIQII